MAAEGIAPVSWSKPQVSVLPGDRLHLHHGPIDLLIKATGHALDVKGAYTAAIERFATVLGELTSELACLRKPLAGSVMPRFLSPVAKRMALACWPHRIAYITPMAAVAGSVADEMLATMMSAAPDIHTVYVNNGGDIAVHVAQGQILKIGVVADLADAIPEGVITVTPESGIGGLATSGWRGRSFSLGIADAVTVLARSAAAADAAATIIANAVNTDDPAIFRAPARTLDPESDLGNQLVTIDVHFLPETTVQLALRNGEIQAQSLIDSRQIVAAFLCLQGQTRVLVYKP